MADPEAPPTVDFDTDPSRYRHWRLEVEGRVARLVLDVDEQGGLVPGYDLKLNSYDLGVDIELYDALQRIRFEHPTVGAVVVTSAKERTFSAGANIRMLAQSSHAWKVNFCKFTNETRNGMEDSSASSGIRFLAALNGATAGGGYEIALACDEILLVDDGSSTVALPELPLLGVLPGTGGLTRLVDKRGVRRDLADVFATKAEGVRGRTAVDWRLVDEVVPPRKFADVVAERASAAADASVRPADAAGIALLPLVRTLSPNFVHETGHGTPGPSDSVHEVREGEGITYPHVTARLDRNQGVATITVSGPAAVPGSVDELHAQGADAWLLAVTRELDDLILRLRTNELEVGTWLLETRGDPAVVAAYDEFLLDHRDDWLVNETVQYWKRTLKRLDVTSRSLIAVVVPDSCFAGSLAELALAADRSYMLDDSSATFTLTAMSDGVLPMGNGLSRLASRFYGDSDALDKARKLMDEPLTAADAVDAGLVTFAFDDIDWDDELRLAIEERGAFSPDALTGMEAQHRFVGPETVETKIFGRLSAWQNWVFQRPNAAGPDGALRRYGTGQRPSYDRKRV